MGKTHLCRGQSIKPEFSRRVDAAARWRRWLALAALLSVAALASAQPWRTLGPDGGDVRSLAHDPKDPDRIFLGTSAGSLYLSVDGGANWTRYAQLGNSRDLVLDRIAIDPSDPATMYVAAWSIESSNGDLFRTRDGGKTWNTLLAMHGKSVRSLTIAPSDPKTLVAGSRDGVYRTRDSGETWERISPENHAEIKNIESVAVAPDNADVIYAGTRHLPWKTEDGGQHWHSIKKGIIDDSDVFSIIIDSANPSTVYASACSGIYKSESAGELFRKIQGIPFSARRTRVLRMDPADHRVVYAGTTEGLWKTGDAGATWKRVTGANVVVNDILLDPRNTARILMATDRGGVLASNDAGAMFAASNRGFAHRQVAALLVDRNDGSILYAGVLNDKEFGGVFVSRDNGQSWKQMSEGLDGRDVFVLRQAQNGTIVAGTDRGIFQLSPAPGQENVRWQPLNTVEIATSSLHTGRSTAASRSGLTSSKPASEGREELNARVTGLELSPGRWFASTSIGLLISTDQGKTWRGGPIYGIKEMVGVSLLDRMVVAAGRHSVWVSVNGGESWLTGTLSGSISAVNSVTVDSNGVIWLGAREGVFRSTNAGDSWQYMGTLPLSNIIAIRFDEENHRLLAVGSASTSVFESADNGRSWHRTDSGWLLRDLRTLHGRVIAATAFDGVVIQPEPSAQVTEVSSGSGNP